jgi:hypothetical protein
MVTNPWPVALTTVFQQEFTGTWRKLQMKQMQAQSQQYSTKRKFIFALANYFTYCFLKSLTFFCWLRNSFYYEEVTIEAKDHK